MIPSALKNRLQNSLLFFILLITNSALSQPTDTVVVYEYVFKTDTVWLDPKPEHDSLFLEKLKTNDGATLILNAQDMKADLRINSLKSSATFPVKNIILSETNKSLGSMKKLTFLGLTLLAVNSSLFAQDRPEKSIGIYLRANSVFQQRLYPQIDWYHYTREGSWVSTFEVTPSMGVKGNFPLSSFFSLSPRVSYSQVYGLINNYSVGVKSFNNVPHYVFSYGDDINTSLKQNGFDTIYYLYSESPTSKFHFLTTDILLNYYFIKGEKIDARIYGGLRIGFVLAQTKDQGIEEIINTSYERVVFDYSGGVGFDFGNRVFFEFEYSYNIKSFVNTEVLKVNLGTASVNLGYYLFK